MAFLHVHSCECAKTELELFSLPPTQTAIESAQWVHYKPISSLNDNSPIEFVVQGQGDEYIDLAHTMLSVRVSLPEIDDAILTAHQAAVAAAGAGAPPQPAPADRIIAPVNNFMHSLFNQVDVYFNQKPVSPPNNLYAYRAYIETLLNYGWEAKNTHLHTVGWSTDSSNGMDSMAAGNIGLSRRAEWLKNGKTCDYIGHLHCDVFNQERFLLNGVEMRLRLTKSRDSFCLMSNIGTDRIRLNINDATLMIRRVKLSPSILLSHARMLAKSTAKYPLTRVEVKAVSIHAGVRSETVDNVILGQLPRRLIVGFVDNSAFNGSFQHNPFNFKHYSLNYLSLYVDGRQIPSKPLQPSFGADEQLYVEAYHTIFSGSGIHFANEGNQITRYDFARGFGLFTFDLTPDLSANSNTHWNLIRHGSVRLEVRFGEALAATINCIIYAEYENILEIDASRQVSVDFTG